MALTKISTAMWNSVPHHDTHDFNVDDVLYVDVSADRVGIGTTNPNAALDVLGSAKIGPNRQAIFSESNGNNSAIIFSSTGNMEFRGSETDYYHLFLKQGGNVGIGTANPVALLHINGSGDAIRVTSTNTGAGGAQMDLLHFTTSPADNDVHGVINFGGYYSGTSSAYGSAIKSVWSDVSAKKADLQFFTRNDADFSERMRIESSGVSTFYGPIISEGPDGGMVMREWPANSAYGMIGTANMANDEYSLLTNGSETFIGSGSGGATYIRGGANDSSPEMLFDGSQVLVKSNGADTLFGIQGNSTGQYDPILNFLASGNPITTEGAQIWYDNSVGDLHISTTYANDAADIHFYTGTGTDKGTNNERLTISGNGKVGIGAPNPAATLHVYNPAGGNATDKASMLSEAVLKLQPHTTNSTNLLVAQVNNGYGIGLQVTNGSATANWDLALSPFGGNVGIGINNPTNTTHIYKNATIGAITSTTTANAGLRIQDSGASMYFDGNSIVLDNTGYLTTNGAHDFVLGTNNTARIHVDSGGNVGIGTTTPISVLDVNGIATLGGGSTAGVVAIQDNYNGNDHLGIIGWARSSGGPYLGYGVKQEGSADWKSTYDNFSGERAYAKLDEDSFELAWSAAQSTAVNSVVNMTPKFKFDLQGGNLTLTDSSPEITFETGASHYNWQLAAQENVNAAFDISVGSADGDASNDTFTNVFTVYQASSGYTLSSGSSRAPIFYDSDNTGYYLNPAESSNMASIALNGSSYSSGIDSVTDAALVIDRGLKIYNDDGSYLRSILQFDTSAQINVGQGGTALISSVNLLPGNAGYVYAANQMRAPIFYDSDNTGYYVDPNSTSLFNRIEINSDLDVRGQVGTWIASDIMNDAIGWNTSYGVYIGSNVGGTHYLRGNGTFTTGGNTYNLWHQGNDGSGSGLDADLLDGSHATAFLNTSYLSGRSISDANLADNYGVTAYYLASGASNKPTGTDHSLLTLSYSNIWSTQLAADWRTSRLWHRGQSNGTWLSWREVALFGVAPASGADLRAPIFYDSDNTGYFVDPHNTSNINYLNGNGKQIFDTADSYLRINQSNAFSNGIWVGSSNILQGSGKYIAAGSNGGTTSSRVYIYGGTYNGSNIIKIDGSNGRIQTVADSMRAPIFYDSNDTTYYVNPAGDSYNLGLSRALAEVAGWVVAYGGYNENYAQWIETEDATQLYGYGDTSVGMVHRARRVKSGQTVRFTITLKSSVAVTSGMYLRLQVYNGNLPDGKTHVSNAAGSSSPFVQEDSAQITSWYENGALGTSWQTEYFEYTATADCYISLLVLNWTGAGTARFYVKTPDIQTVASPAGNTYTNFYWASDTNYGLVGNDAYFDTVDSGLTTDPLELVYSRGTEVRIGNGGGTKPIKASVFYEGANTAYYLDPGSTGDSLRAAGDVIAYYSSDKRLKDNIIKIDAALDKVNAIGGYTFDWNEESHKETGSKDVGVIAQEVEEIFPEIVQTRSNGYKAVNYEKLVPLLIEAIKELSEKVKILENK